MVVDTLCGIPRSGGISDVQLSEPLRMEWQCVDPNGSGPFHSRHHRAASVQRLCIMLPIWLDAVEQKRVSCKPSRARLILHDVTLLA